MDGFDREALTAKAGKSDNGKWFWAAIAALPVVGIAAGLALGMGESSPEPIHGIDMPERSTVMAAAPKAELVQVAAAEPQYSARAEYEKYRMTLSTLTQCGGGYGKVNDHMAKAVSTYRAKNSETALNLQKLVSEQDRQRALARLDRMPDTQMEVWVAGMTGQIQREVQRDLQDMNAHSKYLESLNVGYLGTNPSNPDCIQFRNEVMMGKHNIRLG